MAALATDVAFKAKHSQRLCANERHPWFVEANAQGVCPELELHDPERQKEV